MTRPAIVHSTVTDPFFNHALEESLLRAPDRSAPLLFTYTNRRGIVVGRNQIPWLECNLTRLQGCGMVLSRRLTGGGTVYQDLGNANFGIIAPRSMYDPVRHLELAKKTLKKFGLDTRIGDQRSLFCELRKISGSAFMLTTATTVQHATMLIRADLNTLRSALQTTPIPIETNAVESVPAHVANLSEFRADIDLDTFYDALRQTFKEIYGAPDDIEIVGMDSDQANTDNFKELLAKYSSDEWILGRTPKFTYKLELESCTLAFKVANGKFTQVQGRENDEWPARLTEQLEGRYFHPDAIRDAIEKVPHTPAQAAPLIQKLTRHFTAQPFDPIENSNR